MTKIPQYLLALAGEYRICSELNKRGVFATITYGNHKGVDVYAIRDGQRRALKIEVKTVQVNSVVTGIFKKYKVKGRPAPDFWVVFQILPGEKDGFAERFFILTHEEICRIQDAVNENYAVGYRKRHGIDPDFSKGPDCVSVESIKGCEDKWEKIVREFGGPEADSPIAAEDQACVATD